MLHQIKHLRHQTRHTHMKRAEKPDAMQQRATQYTSEWSGLLDPTRAARDTPTLGHPPDTPTPPKIRQPRRLIIGLVV